MTLTIGDVGECIVHLECGDRYKFVLEANGDLRPFVDDADYSANGILVLTPEWYDLTYCANGWDDETLLKELEEFRIMFKKMDDQFISTRFIITWK